MGYKRNRNNRWNQFQQNMVKPPSLPALPSQTMQGGQGAKGQASLGSGYSKARRFGTKADLDAFLKEHSIGYDGCKTNLSEPSDLLKF